MREKEPLFTVTDRRKFTAEGELRDGDARAEEIAEPPAVNLAATAAAPAPIVPEPAVEEAVELGDDEIIPKPSAADAAQQRKDYSASSSRLDDMLSKANPGQPVSPVMNFERLVQSLYMTAAMQMGAGAEANEQPRIDILGARQSIDMLLVLEEKTKGNLGSQEQRLLQNALFDLRMSFLEITNAIANSAQRPPKVGKPH